MRLKDWTDGKALSNIVEMEFERWNIASIRLLINYCL